MIEHFNICLLLTFQNQSQLRKLEEQTAAQAIYLATSFGVQLATPKSYFVLFPKPFFTTCNEPAAKVCNSRFLPCLVCHWKICVFKCLVLKVVCNGDEWREREREIARTCCHDHTSAVFYVEILYVELVCTSVLFFGLEEKLFLRKVHHKRKENDVRKKDFLRTMRERKKRNKCCISFCPTNVWLRGVLLHD